MSGLDETLQNLSDITGEVTVSLNAVITLVTTLIAFGEKAYPYIVNIINQIIDLYKELGKQYDVLEKLKNEIETKIAESGIIVITDLDDFVAEVEVMHAKQQAAFRE